MKRIVMTGPKKSQIVDMPDVKPSDDEVLIKLKYVGVCMSEHYDWSVARAGQAFGHEPLGFIAAIGKNVTGFKVGERVSGLWGSTLPGAGGLIQYQTADPRKSTIVKIPDNVRSEDAVLEPLSCLLSAVSKVRIGVPGDAVCVVGCGYMGCGAISLLKLKGAYVVAVDIRAESRADAKKYGADEVLTPEEALAKYNAKEPAGFGLVMEWGETNESLDAAINLTRMCGQLCIGAYHTGGKRLVDVQQLNVKAIDCLSTHPREGELNAIGARNAALLLSSGAWNYKNIPVKIYPMSGFDLANEELGTKYGKYMKALIDMEKVDGEAYIL
jgi:threonine dehydrogenase-like Zn-dependent dehydrogenase